LVELLREALSVERGEVVRMDGGRCRAMHVHDVQLETTMNE
jgi:hypothetical protein